MCGGHQSQVGWASTQTGSGCSTMGVTRLSNASARLTLACVGADPSVVRKGSNICTSIVGEGSNCRLNSTGCGCENRETQGSAKISSARILGVRPNSGLEPYPSA